MVTGGRITRRRIDVVETTGVILDHVTIDVIVLCARAPVRILSPEDQAADERAAVIAERLMQRQL
jgi:hypothetical protein